MKEKLQNIIDNHCKQFCELSEDQFPITPKELWREMIKNLGCFFYILYMKDKTGMPFDPEVEVAQRHGLSSGQYIFLQEPCSDPRSVVPSTRLVRNDLSLKILCLGYLP